MREKRKLAYIHSIPGGFSHCRGIKDLAMKFTLLPPILSLRYLHPRIEPDVMSFSLMECHRRHSVCRVYSPGEDVVSLRFFVRPAGPQYNSGNAVLLRITERDPVPQSFPTKERDGASLSLSLCLSMASAETWKPILLLVLRPRFFRPFSLKIRRSPLPVWEKPESTAATEKPGNALPTRERELLATAAADSTYTFLSHLCERSFLYVAASFCAAAIFRNPFKHLLSLERERERDSLSHTIALYLPVATRLHV